MNWSLRMYYIDTTVVPESSNACTFHCLYDYHASPGEDWINSDPIRAACVKHEYYTRESKVIL